MKIGLIKTKIISSDPVGDRYLSELELMINDRKNNGQVMAFSLVQSSNFQRHRKAFQKVMVFRCQRLQ